MASTRSTSRGATKPAGGCASAEKESEAAAQHAAAREREDMAGLWERIGERGFGRQPRGGPCERSGTRYRGERCAGLYPAAGSSGTEAGGGTGGGGAAGWTATARWASEPAP